MKAPNPSCLLAYWDCWCCCYIALVLLRSTSTKYCQNLTTTTSILSIIRYLLRFILRIAFLVSSTSKMRPSSLLYRSNTLSLIKWVKIRCNHKIPYINSYARPKIAVEPYCNICFTKIKITGIKNFSGMVWNLWYLILEGKIKIKEGLTTKNTKLRLIIFAWL